MSDWKLIIAHALAMGVVTSLVAVLAGGLRRRRTRASSAVILANALVGIAVAVTTFFIDLNAKREGNAVIRHAFEALMSEGESQVRALMHAHASDIADLIAELDRPVDTNDLARVADAFGLDAVTLADTNGVVTVTSDAAHRPGADVVTNAVDMAEYRELCTGARRYVNRRFAPWSAAGQSDWMKYFACPLPERRGMLQIGVRWSSFQKEFPKYFIPVLDGRPVGDTGFFAVFDADGRAVVAIRDRDETLGMTLAEAGFSDYDLSCPPGKVFHVPFLGVQSRCMGYEPMGGYRMFAVLPLAETQGGALLMSALVALVLLVVSVVFRLVLVRFQQAQAKIDALRAQEEARRTADLALARAIQRAELRTDGTQGPGYRLQARMDPAREVGGDFYDYYTLPDGRLVVVMADVSGKGIPAAFFMMKARMTLKACVYACPTLAEAVAEANVRLARNNPAEMFVTVWVGVWNRASGALEFVSAGHNPPLACRREGAVEWLRAPRAMALGVFESARYQSAETGLKPGDRLFLYTDGVTEAMNATGAFFGEERLRDAVASGGNASLVDGVRSAVDAFVAGAEQSDDITVLELGIQ